MANKGLQLLGFTLSLLGLIGLIFGTVLPQWKMSAYVGDNIITAIAMYQGLWMSCAFQSTGQMQCKVYDSILQLDGSLQATRALMIVAILLTVAGLGVASMGMKCTNCGGDDKVKKSRIAMTGGIILIVGALCSIVACGWFTNQIVKDFYNPFTPVNTKYVQMWLKTTSKFKAFIHVLHYFIGYLPLVTMKGSQSSYYNILFL
uniref:Claudin n=1 Tax=Sinocyclocheilus grahami TaxID=75366 RepID=A0A672S1M9_SINGR